MGDCALASEDITNASTSAVSSGTAVDLKGRDIFFLVPGGLNSCFISR